MTKPKLINSRYPKFNFKKPDYVQIYQERARRLQEVRTDRTKLVAMLKHYECAETGHIDFVQDWFMTYDPRCQPAWMPFILFPKQIEYLNWLREKYENKNDGLAEKSRDVGFTWLNIAFALWLWRFRSGSKVSFGSRKQDLVDKIGDPDSIFEKIRTCLIYLPPEVLPYGFNYSAHVPFLKVINPDNGNTITGEAGDNIGRGGRSSMYFKDEAQPLDSKILTPSGWRLMGDMETGDNIIGANGNSHIVTQIKDFGDRDIYRIGFSDGTHAECSPNHLWTVEKVIGKRQKLTINTKQLAKDFVYDSPGGQRQYKYRIPACSPVQFGRSNKPLPLAPYLVGALLGDGSVKYVPRDTPTITSGDNEIFEYFKELLPGSCVLSQESKISCRIIDAVEKRGTKKKSRAKEAVVDAGIAGCGAENKFIPDIYKFSSPENRFKLLQGLMDTDGSASGGVASFHTCSERLAKDVIFVVQSLGGTATHNIKPDHRGFRDMHVLHVAFPDGKAPFRLPRKIKGLRPRKHPVGRTIISIAIVDKRPVRCISIDADDGLYLTDNFIVTHNSAFYEHPEIIDAALSQNSDVKIDCSTPNGAGNPFYTKRHGGLIDVFTFHWKDDPRKDQDWYNYQKRTLTPVIVAQEIDIDYHASIEGICIPAEWVRAAINLELEESGARTAGLDVADNDGGGDDNAWCFRHGVVLKELEVWTAGNTTQTARRAHLLCSKNNVEHLNYDNIGVGSGIKGELWSLDQKANYSFSHAGINFGSKKLPGFFAPGKTNKDMFANLKAKLWWDLRCRFERTWEHVNKIKEHDVDKLISIPNNPKLIAQLSTARVFANEAGKMQMVSKKVMKIGGIQSPNEAEAVVYCYAETRSTAQLMAKRTGLQKKVGNNGS